MFSTAEEMLEHFKKGDSRCPIKIGQKVKKVNSEKGDGHPTGSVGIVVGNLHFIQTIEGVTYENLYMVEFDGPENPPIFIVDKKLELADR